MVDALFKPGVKINPEHKSKYIYLLAYAASVCDIPAKKGHSRKLNKDELKTTIQAIEKVHNICNINKGSTELIAELQTLYQSIRYNDILNIIFIIIYNKIIFNLIFFFLGFLL